MAIAFDATSTKVAANDTSWSHTCTGSNLVLFVTISSWKNGGTGAGATTVTYNSVSMTKVANTPASNGAFYSEIWALVNPTTGANTIATSGIVSTTTKASGISFTGADQTTGVDIANSTTGTTGSVTLALTLGATNEYMVDCASHLSANRPSAHSDTIVLNDATSGASGVSQYGSKAGSGSQSMSYTYPDPGDAWAYSVLAVKAVSVGVVGTNTGMTMGMGS